MVTTQIFCRKTDTVELITYSDNAGSTQNQLLNPTLNTEVPWGLTADTAKTYAFGAVVTPSNLSFFILFKRSIYFCCYGRVANKNFQYFKSGFPKQRLAIGRWTRNVVAVVLPILVRTASYT